MSQPPPTPEGYQPPIAFSYPRVALQIWAFILMFASIPLFLYVGWQVNGRPDGLPFEIGSNFLQLGWMIVSLFITIIIHELVHGVGYQLLGYKVSYGLHPQMVAAYAAAFGQYQTRNHNLMVALAPLVVLTAVFVPLMAVNNNWLQLFAFIGLVMNTSGAVGDIYLSWRLLRLPPQALMYDASATEMYILLPQS
jgi:hypothetical protein